MKLQHDVNHDMYLPDKPAKKSRRHYGTPLPRGTSQAEKEAWMRERQQPKPPKPIRDRHHENSVINQLLRIEKRRAELNAPDLSGEWAI
jgi:hypothetical protein